MAQTTTDSPPADEAEKVEAHLVEEEAPPTDEQADRDDGVNALASLALASPGLPGRDEVLVLAMTAKILSASQGVKEGYRNNPHLCFQAVLVGRELGIGPTTALQMIDPIPDKGGYNLTLSPRLLNARLAQLGVGRLHIIRNDAVATVLRPLGPGGEVLGDDEEFTWEDAQDAGSAGLDCKPTEDGKRIHHSRPWVDRKKAPPCGCKSTYYSFPKRMMMHRVTGYAADNHFPEARLGLYSADELGAITDEAGNAIGLEELPVPAGYELPPPPLDPNTQPADPEALQELHERIAVLVAAGEQWAPKLRARWNQSRLAGVKVADLSMADVRLASSLVASTESEAKRTGVDLEALKAERAAADAGSPGGEGAREANDPGAGAPGPDGPPQGQEPERRPTTANQLGLDPAVIEEAGTAPGDLIHHLTTHVKSLEVADVDEALTKRGELRSESPESARRATLVVLMVVEELREAKAAAADRPQAGGSLFTEGEPQGG